MSATEILLDLIGIDSSDVQAWFDHGERIQSARAAGDVDAELDRRLIQLATEQDSLVIDSWALAWTCHVPMIRLWFESDTTSRTWKCFVSQGDQPRHDLTSCGQIITNKDSSTRDFFLDQHGFDLFTNREVFDALLDNTHLIQEPTKRSADAGIAKFEPVVTAVAASLLGDAPDVLKSAFKSWTACQRKCVTHVNRPWSDGIS